MITCLYTEDDLRIRTGGHSYYPRLFVSTKRAFQAWSDGEGWADNAGLRELIIRDLIDTADLTDRRLLDYAPPSVPLPLSATVMTRLAPPLVETLRIRQAALGIGFNCYVEGVVRRKLAELGLVEGKLRELVGAGGLR